MLRFDPNTRRPSGFALTQPVEDRIIGIAERNQCGAVVLDFGAGVLVQRFRLGHLHGAPGRAARLAKQAQHLAVRYGVRGVVSERGAGVAEQLQSVRLMTEEISLREAKSLLLSLDVRQTNRALFKKVMAERPVLRRHGSLDRDCHVESLGEPDRWRTVALLAAALILAAKRRGTSTN